MGAGLRCAESGVARRASSAVMSTSNHSARAVLLGASLLVACGSTAAPSPRSTSTATPAELVFDGPRSGCALHVSSTGPEGETGTMHYAERVVLSVGPGAPVELTTDVEAGTLAPIVERAIDLGGAYLVLGWSSWGGGTQTNTALIVESGRCGGLTLVDRLDVVSSRSIAGLLVDPSTPAIGIPTRLRSDPELAVTLGARPLAIDGAASVVAGAEWFAPPMGTTAGDVEAVWLAASEAGLRRD